MLPAVSYIVHTYVQTYIQASVKAIGLRLLVKCPCAGGQFASALLSGVPLVFLSPGLQDSLVHGQWSCFWNQCEA